MSSRKYRARQNITALFLASVFIAQSCSLNFFPVYLKYLNFSAIEVGIICASQTWISELLVPAWLFVMKQLPSVSWKRFVTSVFLVVNITLHLCLTFLPTSNILRDVTHCHGHTSYSLVEELVRPLHDHFKSISQVPSPTANVTMKRPTINIFYANETSLPLSMVTKQDSLSTVIYHDIAKQVSDNSNISSQNHSKVLPISSTKEKNDLLESTTETAKNISLSPNIQVMSSSMTEQMFLPEMVKGKSMVSTVNPKLPVLINNESSPESNKNTSTLTGDEIEFTQTPIFKEVNYSSTHKIQKPVTMSTSVCGESNDFENSGNYSHELTSQNKTEHTESGITSAAQKAITDEQDNKTEQIPCSGSDSEKIYHNSEVMPPINGTVIGHISPNDKIWHHRSHTSWSEPWNAHSNHKPHSPKQESEERYVPVTSKRNKIDDTTFYETWPQKHAVLPLVQHRYLEKNHARGNNLKNDTQATSDYKITGNLEDYSSDEQSTNRLQPDIAGRTEDLVESPQEFENQINVPNKSANVKLWGEHQHHLPHHRKFKSRRKMEQAEQEERTLPTTTEELKDLSAVRRMQKNMKQKEEFYPHEGQLRRKRVSRPATFKSQEAKHLTRNISKKLTRNHPTHHTTKHYGKRNTKHKRSKAMQSSPYAKNLRYRRKRETKEAYPMQGTIRRLMFVDSSKSKHYDEDDTNLQLDKDIIPQSDKNISMLLWNVIRIYKLPDYWSTTFITILLLAVLAEVFSRAITATSSQFLQYKEPVKASGHKPMTSQNSSQQIYALLGWGLFGCPLLAALVLATECSYQPRVFLLFSTGLFMMNLLVSLFLLQLPSKNWDWKLQDCENERKQGHTSLLQR